MSRQERIVSREPWARRVVGELKVGGLTRKALADSLDDPVSERTIRNVLDGVVAPDPQRVAQIAKAVGLDPLTLFQDLGWVSPQLGATDDTRSVATEAVKLLHDRRAQLPRGPWQLVDRAVELGTYRAHMTTASTSSGVRWRDYVGLVATEPRGASTNGVPDPELEHQLREDFAVSLRLAPALLEDSDFLRTPIHRQWPTAHAWFWVPFLLSTRDAQTRLPLATGVDTVVVIGEHGAGADDIGAYLADWAGWGYANTSFEAQRAFARSPRNQATHAQRCLELTDAYLRSWHGRFRVISHGNPATATEVINRVQRFDAEQQQRGDTAPRRVALVYARANDALIEYGTRMWGTRMDPVIPGKTADYRDANNKALAAYAKQLEKHHDEDGARRACVVAIDLSQEQLSRRAHYQKEVDLDPLFVTAAQHVWQSLRPAPQMGQ